MSSVAIRPAAALDFASIDRFDPFAGDRNREITERRLLVAEAEDQVVGYVSWLPAGFVGRDYVTFLCVQEAYRHQGISRLLLRAAESHLVGRVFISTEEDNLAMLAMLPADGWAWAGAVAAANEGDRAEVFFYKEAGA